eukprot:gi/632980391/ref/XP_007907007.1/ PREDICTED: uncharacterized protein LOC103188736 [Callorhinchus milii]
MCAALYSLHGSGDHKMQKEEASKEEKKEFPSFVGFVDQSITGPSHHVPDMFYKFDELEDQSYCTAQHKLLDNVGKQTFCSNQHESVTQDETKVSDFTVKLREMKSGPAHSENSVDGLRMGMLDGLGDGNLKSPNRRYKLLNFCDRTPSAPYSGNFSQVKPLSPQRCPSMNKTLGNIPDTLDLKVADNMSRNVGLPRKCSFEKTPLKSKPHAKVSNHLDHNVVVTPGISVGGKGVSTLARSPVKQVASEEELYSPNTTEKYKLLSVLGLRRKTSVIDDEELTGWKQKRRLRQPKVKNYSLLGGTRRRKAADANTELQGDKVQRKTLADCFVVIEKIIPPIQKPKRDAINQASFALKKRETLSHKNMSQGHTGKNVACIPSTTQINNPKVKATCRLSCSGRSTKQGLSKSGNRGGNALKKTERSQKSIINLSIATKRVKKGGKPLPLCSLKQNSVLSKPQKGSPLTKKITRFSKQDINVKSSSLRDSTASRLPCNEHNARGKTRTSFNSTSDCRKYKAVKVDHKMASCPGPVQGRGRLSRTRSKPSLNSHTTRQTRKSFSIGTCASVLSENSVKQALEEKKSKRLPARTEESVKICGKRRENKRLIPNVCKNSLGVEKRLTTASALKGKLTRNDKLNPLHLRSKQDIKKQEQLQTAYKSQERQTRASSCVTQECRRKAQKTRYRSLDAENQNVNTIKTNATILRVGKRTRIPTQKLIEAGFSFGLFTPSQHQLPSSKGKFNRMSARAKNKQFALRSSQTMKINNAARRKMVLKRNSRKTTSKLRGNVASKTSEDTIVGQKSSAAKPRCRGRKSSRSETSEKMTESSAAKMKKTKPIVLYGKKLVNLNIKSLLVKKRCPNSRNNTIKKDAQLSTSQKAKILHKVASAGSKPIGSKDVPKNLRGAAEMLRKIQPEVREMLKRAARRKTAEQVKKTKAPARHTCRECSTTFTNCDSLFMHRIRHTKGKLWPCLLCEKSFFRRTNVQIHLRCHREELYRCKRCVKESKKTKLSVQSKR